MIFFLFIPTESGQPEMSALEATTLQGAIEEAESLPFAGRTGYLFDGDIFVQAVSTADTLAPAPSPIAVTHRPPPARPENLPPRPG